MAVLPEATATIGPSGEVVCNRADQARLRQDQRVHHIGSEFDGGGGHDGIVTCPVAA
jgi:hypothetical protein